MALDEPAKNKMVTTPPAKKGFHFAATAEYLAEFIEAETIAEAETIYQKVKRLIGQPAPAAPVTPPAPAAAEQPTDLPATNP